MTRPQQGRLPDHRKTEAGLGVTSQILPPLCSITITPQTAQAARERIPADIYEACRITDADLANPNGWIRA